MAASFLRLRSLAVQLADGGHCLRIDAPVK
jgi:hypothetical protein